MRLDSAPALAPIDHPSRWRRRARSSVRAAPGTDTAALTRTLTDAVADQPGARVADRAAVATAFAARQQDQLLINYLFIAGIVGYTVISLVNTMVVATARRRREFGLQRLIGSTRGQVLRMVGTEAFLVGVAGAVLGSTVAALTVTRLPPSTWGPLWIYPAIAGGAIVLTVVAALFSATLVVRGRPITAATTGTE